jgi:hypothetical protein
MGGSIAGPDYQEASAGLCVVSVTFNVHSRVRNADDNKLRNSPPPCHCPHPCFYPELARVLDETKWHGWDGEREELVEREKMIEEAFEGYVFDFDDVLGKGKWRK